MEQNQIIHNFIVTSIQPVEELFATLYQMEHKKSGAKLVWLDRQEENKTFGISFQTQPWDDTGVFHILEHSVLCGSQKYPVKEPFVELLKSSLNTFLNAMTFPDKTIYPVSSRNDQDFINLVRVYMDAVLHPLIYQKPEIFGQEGWHYQFSSEGEPSYKGVVFNEMKGAFASPDTLMENEINRRLFPDTCYRFVSGGDPAHIPELSAQQLAQTHSRLYHPSNAYIFLDGDIAPEKVLKLLDEEYLAEYSAVPAPAPIPFQQPVNAGVSEIFYELSTQEELEGRVRLADGFVACTYQDREVLTALQALADTLCGDNHASLTKRLLDNKLAKNVSLSVRDGILQPFVTLEVQDIREEQMEEVASALKDELEKLIREGLDHQRILAALDNMEFQARQRDYGRMPQGLIFGMQIMESWLYGGDPGANLSVGSLYNNLRNKCKEGFFEDLLERVLLKNPHRCRVIMRPSHTLSLVRQNQENARLESAKAKWDETEIASLKTYQASIDAWQSSIDSPEALATIPMLSLDQIDPEPEKLPIDEEIHSGIKVLAHRLPTSGITYLNLYFSLDDMSIEHLPVVSFLCAIMGSLDTEKYKLKELQRALRSRCGQVRFAVNGYSRFGCREECKRFLVVTVSALDSKLAQAVELMNEVLSSSILNDSTKIYDLLRQRRAAFADDMAMAGHVISMNRAMSSCSTAALVQDYTAGIAYYQWLKELEENFQDRFSQLAEELTAIARDIFCRSRLVLAVTSGEENSIAVASGLLAQGLPEGKMGLPVKIKPWPCRREGIVIPADVSFAGMAGIFAPSSSGDGRVMARTAALAYLWNTVRVQGGAYGVGLLPEDSGTLGFYSYRDPSAERTLNCYAQIPGFLRACGGLDITGFILGAVAETEPLLTARLKGARADARYWRQIGQQDLQRLRREILAVKPEDLVDLADALEQTIAKSSVCVMGSRQQIDQCGEKLDSIIIV